MKHKTKGISLHQRWVILFGCWLLLLSGGLANCVGSPGVLQAVRLKNLLDLKKDRLSLLQLDLQKLQAEALELENNKSAQVREIRRVLGYAASDELIFDFTNHNQF